MKARPALPMRALPERPGRALGPPVSPRKVPAPGRAAQLEAAQTARPTSEPETLRPKAVRAVRPTTVTRPVTKLLEKRGNPMCLRSGWPALAHRPIQETAAKQSSERQGSPRRVVPRSPQLRRFGSGEPPAGQAGPTSSYACDGPSGREHRPRGRPAPEGCTRIQLACGGGPPFRLRGQSINCLSAVCVVRKYAIRVCKINLTPGYFVRFSERRSRGFRSPGDPRRRLGR